MTESELLAQILLTHSRANVRLMRTNSGIAWAGRIISQDHKRIVISPYHAVKLCPEGTADTCGFVSEIITPAMVDSRIAIATGLELKVGRNKVTTEQQAFGDMLRSFGGRWGIARSVGDAGLILSGKL